MCILRRFLGQKQWIGLKKHVNKIVSKSFASMESKKLRENESTNIKSKKKTTFYTHFIDNEKVMITFHSPIGTSSNTASK